jgi:salicylate hydroxylase
VWKVVEEPLLPSWMSKGGNAVVIGDAAHGMTPYQGQVSIYSTMSYGLSQC